MRTPITWYTGRGGVTGERAGGRGGGARVSESNDGTKFCWEGGKVAHLREKKKKNGAFYYK